MEGRATLRVGLAFSSLPTFHKQPKRPVLFIVTSQWNLFVAMYSIVRIVPKKASEVTRKRCNSVEFWVVSWDLYRIRFINLKGYNKNLWKGFLQIVLLLVFWCCYKLRYIFLRLWLVENSIPLWASYFNLFKVSTFPKHIYKVITRHTSEYAVKQPAPSNYAISVERWLPLIHLSSPTTSPRVAFSVSDR